MFAKRAKESKPEQRPQDGAGQTAESGRDPRDGVIKQLEQQLAEERQAAAALREALDASTFKLEILEKSYAKQLADARERLTKTEAQLADKQKVLAAFDGGHEEALRALTEARAELKQANTERDQLRKQVAEGGYRQRDERGTRVPLGLQGDQAGGTINQLIANAGWDDGAVLRVARDVITRGLSVRETEALVKKLAEGAAPRAPGKPAQSDVHTRAAEDALRLLFGTRVRIVRKGSKGRIEIDFGSEDELIRIYEQMTEKNL